MNGADYPAQNAIAPKSGPPPPAVPFDDERVLRIREAEERKQEIQEIRELIEENQTGNKETRTVEWLQLAVNAGLAVIGIIAICVYLGQLYAMNRTLSEIEKQTPEIQKQAKAAQDQLAQAKADSAEASRSTAQQLLILQGQLTQQRRALEVDQRPWLKFELGSAQAPGDDPTSHILPSFVVGQPTKIPVRITNIGKTTAEKVRGGLLVQIVPDGKEPIIPRHEMVFTLPGEPKVKGKSVPGLIQFRANLYPNEITVYSFSRVHMDGTEDPATSVEVNALTAGTAHIYLVGQVWYDDIFGTRHWTKFCETTNTKTIPTSDSGSPALKCARFGSVDSNQTSKKPN